MRASSFITIFLLFFVTLQGATILDFESSLPSGLVAANHTHLATAPSSSVIGDKFAVVGVIFSGATLLNLGSGSTASGVNGFGGLDNLGRFDSGAPITLSFVSPLDTNVLATTDYVSLVADPLNASDNTVAISAYGISGNLLSTVIYNEPAPVFGSSAPIVFSGIGQIHSIVIDPTLNEYSTGNGGIQFDLLTFETLVVPEPSRTCLLGIFFFACFLRRNRR